MIITDLRQTLIKEVKNAPGGSNRPLLRRQRANNENKSNASFSAYAFHRFYSLLEESEIYAQLSVKEITLILRHVYTKLNDNKTSEEENSNNNENSPRLSVASVNKLLTDILEDMDFAENNIPNNLKSVRYSYNAIKGRRRTMEDKHICLPNFDVIFKLNTNSNLHLFAVFDGHGGHLAAEFCHVEYPFILSNLLSKNKSSKINYEEILKKSVIQLNEKFLKNCPDSLSGATASIILYDSSLNKIHSVWVGDSEACLVYPTKNKNPVKLVNPHKLSDPEEVKRIESAGGKVVFYDSPDMVPRLNGTLAIARSIGDKDEIDNGLACLPDYICVDIETKYSAQLVIACDGLWDVCDQMQCSNLLKSNGVDGLTDSEYSVKISRVLVSYAFNQMSSDNISVIVVDVSPEKMKSDEIDMKKNECVISKMSTELNGGVSEEIHNKVQFVWIEIDFLWFYFFRLFELFFIQFKSGTYRAYKITISPRPTITTYSYETS